MRYCNIYKRIMCITAAAVMLSSCTAEKVPDQYTVISEGTSVTSILTETVTVDEKEISDKELYIPKNMVSKYASLDYDFRMLDAYDDVVDTIQNFRDKTLIPLTISIEEYERVLETVRCEQLMLFFLEDRYVGDFNASAQTFELNFTYKYSIAEVNRMLMETEAAAMQIMSLIDDEMTDYEKLKTFHDYLVLNVESSTDAPYADSIYGALVDKKALCEGYAKAFSYLCNMAGIENMIVTGSTGVYHMWNMVKLDGSWYHVDVTWDKPPEALAASYPDMILYQYFLAGDDIMENNRIISNYLCETPKAVADEYNYFVRENKYACDYGQALQIIEDSCRRAIDSGDKYFMLKLDSSNLYIQTAAQLIKPDNNGVSDIDRIVDKLNFTGQISYTDYFNSYRVIIFILE